LVVQKKKHFLVHICCLRAMINTSPTSKDYNATLYALMALFY
jgi:hypothetical protein